MVHDSTPSEETFSLQEILNVLDDTTVGPFSVQ